MVSDIQIWEALVKRYISGTTFSEDGRVYVREGGIHEVPLHDPAAMLQIMNINPHTMKEAYRIWERGGDTVEQCFCEALYNQELEGSLFDKIEPTEALHVIEQMFASLNIPTLFLSQEDLEQPGALRKFFGIDIGDTPMDQVDNFLRQSFQQAKSAKEPLLKNALFTH